MADARKVEVEMAVVTLAVRSWCDTW